MTCNTLLLAFLIAYSIQENHREYLTDETEYFDYEFYLN